MTDLDLFDNIKKSPVFKNELAKQLAIYQEKPIIQQAQIGEIYVGKYLAHYVANQTMAKHIYNITEQNDLLNIDNAGLRKQLGTKLDVSDLKTYAEEEKIKVGANDERNLRIKKDLNKLLLSGDIELANICLLYTSPSPRD